MSLHSEPRRTESQIKGVKVENGYPCIARAAIYSRVSTQDQENDTQLMVLEKCQLTWAMCARSTFKLKAPGETPGDYG